MKKYIIGGLSFILLITLVLVIVGFGGEKTSKEKQESIGVIYSEPILVEDIQVEDDIFDEYAFFEIMNSGRAIKEEELKILENDKAKINIKYADVSKRDYYYASGLVEDYSCNTKGDSIKCDVTLTSNKESLDKYLAVGKRVSLLKGNEELPPCEGEIVEIKGDEVIIRFDNHGLHTTLKKDFESGRLLVKK